VLGISQILNIKSESSSEMLVTVYEATRRHNPEDMTLKFSSTCDGVAVGHVYCFAAMFVTVKLLSVCYFSNFLCKVKV
jgi:hypothetical protein